MRRRSSQEESSDAPSSAGGYSKTPTPPTVNRVIRFKTTFDVDSVIYDVMRRRGWRECQKDSTEWDFLWVERDVAYDTFDNLHLLAGQRVNHFRNDRELCRKDLLVKNLKRRKKMLEKEGPGSLEEAQAYEFWPTTYSLPGEYSLFADTFKRFPNSTWIMKPISSSQGKGIFIFTKISQISRWKSDGRWLPIEAKKDAPAPPAAYVVQRYISNPYLVAGRKFDMRLYVLVTSYQPLQAWIYRGGFCRFSHIRYSNAAEDMEDMERHLTNVAVQRKGDSYDKVFGGKWDVRGLKLYLMSRHGKAITDKLFAEIELIMIRALQSVRDIMIQDKHCFELYGYDIIFDEEFKPWLLEVNASPSLSANTEEDRQLKSDMLDSMLDIIDMEGIRNSSLNRVGGFDLVSNIDAGGQDSNTYRSYIGTIIPTQPVESKGAGLAVSTAPRIET